MYPELTPEQIAQMTPEEIARIDAEDRALDPDDGIDYEEIIQDFLAERRGERPPAIRIESPEHLRAFIEAAARGDYGSAR
jgi:hypothetical protein